MKILERTPGLMSFTYAVPILLILLLFKIFNDTIFITKKFINSPETAPKSGVEMVLNGIISPSW